MKVYDKKFFQKVLTQSKGNSNVQNRQTKSKMLLLLLQKKKIRIYIVSIKKLVIRNSINLENSGFKIRKKKG